MGFGMIVKYPVHTVSQHEAIRIAQQTAISNGFKRSIVVSVQRMADTEWLVSLSVQR